MADGSLSQFKATLARKKVRKDKNQGKFNRKKLGFKSADTNYKFDFPDLSESELEEVKTSIREKLKSEKRIETIVLILFFLVGFLILVYIN
ncbi:hypothetical protein L0P88_07875 [Muricauda sp. SCSIO 64092]|uniref:hypothetical protein n=1 Tax=Allomuricauda sp. SCSIO 64092 TaxID=2908842 RepID=UPI001FF49430|nr:hypothetical protein [Muricauda sp. SCSIO 64092]UOY08464.1 hypothetical protein L0P88_07875 [Muricauda sp. SCSIO 64092]